VCISKDVDKVIILLFTLCGESLSEIMEKKKFGC